MILQLKSVKTKREEKLIPRDEKRKKRQLKFITIADIIKHKNKQEQIKDKQEETWLKLQIAGLIKREPSMLGDYRNVQGVWKNEPAFVVGGSYGLKNAMKDGFKLEMLDGFHSIGINHIIEDYDGFEWFIFQDKRFIKCTTYPLFKKYKGRVFVSTRCGMKPKKNVTVFYTQEDQPTEDIMDGLCGFITTGLLALHLAIIAGANPIYLFGFDNGGKVHSKDGAHYKKEYPFEVKGHRKWQPKYLNLLPEACKKYKKFANRVYNVDPLGVIKTFKKISFNEIPELADKKRNVEIEKPIEIEIKEELQEDIQDKKLDYKIIQNKTICHIGTLPIDQMGDITREIFYNAEGKHLYSFINDSERPHADIYVLECFKKDHFKFINFIKPHNKAKVISLIHSSYPCSFAKCSDTVITLTEYDKQRFEHTNIKVIGGGIKKTTIKPNYESLNFGRITRIDNGKIHDKWNDTLREIFKKYPESKCYMFVNKTDNLLIHENIIYDTSIKINEQQKKLKKLSQLSMATFMHSSFIEVFPMAVLECMSIGLPIIAMHQPSMAEMIGKDQILVHSILLFKEEILKLLPDYDRKKEMGKKAKQRAREFTIEKMIKEWNTLYSELLCE